MKIRTTPSYLKERDHQLFPLLAKSFKEREFPLYYYVRKKQIWTTINVDYFFVPHEVRRNLQRLYIQYVEWLITRSGGKKKTYYLSSFHDYTSVTVLTEHAEWWITLFESAASLLVDCYYLTEEDQKEDRREEEEKEQARHEAKRRAFEDKYLIKQLRAKPDERAETLRRLEVFAQEHPDERAALSPLQHFTKGIEICKQIQQEKKEQLQQEKKHAPVFFDGVPTPALDTPPSIKSIAKAFFQRQVPPPPSGQEDIRPAGGRHNWADNSPLKKGTGMVKFFREDDKMAVQTNATDEASFLSEFGVALVQRMRQLPQDEEEQIFEMVRWLNPFVEICCKLRGYKSAAREERMLTAGYIGPQASAAVVSMDDHKRVTVADVPKLENGTGTRG